MYFPVSSLLTEFLILAVVDREDSYGYEISQTVKLVADIKESTLYPILRRLETAELLTVYSQEHGGRLRKYYHITEAGLARLALFMEEWKEIESIYNFIVQEEKGNEQNGI